MFLPLQSMGLSTRLSDYIKYWDRVLSSRSVEKPATASLEPRQVPGLKNVYLFISYKVSNKKLINRHKFSCFFSLSCCHWEKWQVGLQKTGQAPNVMLEILSMSKNKFQSGIWAGGIRRGAIIILVN